MIIFFIHRRDFLYFNVRKLFIFFFQTFCAGCGGCQAHCFEEESSPTQQFLARLCALAALTRWMCIPRVDDRIAEVVKYTPEI